MFFVKFHDTTLEFINISLGKKKWYRKKWRHGLVVRHSSGLVVRHSFFTQFHTGCVLQVSNIVIFFNLMHEQTILAHVLIIFLYIQPCQLRKNPSPHQ